MADSSPMMIQYERIKADHVDSILFFRLGDFYEMFRQDALDASRILSLTLTQRNGVPMCGIPFHAMKTYIPRLLAVGRKIAICEQTSQPQVGKGIVDREVVQIISPGTVIDEEYLEQGNNNFLLSVSGTSGHLSAALFDMSTGELYVQTIDQTEIIGDLQTLLAKWQPRELLIQESLLAENAAVQTFIHDHPDLVLNRFGDWLYDMRTAQEELCRLMNIHSLKSFGLEDRDPLIHPIAAILNYAEHAAKHSLDHVRSIHVIRHEGGMQLDETSVKNLEIVRNLHDNTRNFSLLAVLDHTKSPMGARLLRRRMLEPLRDKQTIEERLDVLEFLYHHQSLLTRLREQLGAMADVQRLANRVTLDKAHPKDVVALARSIRRMLRVVELCSEVEAENPAACHFIKLDTEKIAACVSELEKALIDEPALVLNEGNIIRTGFDKQVDEYRDLRNNGQSILDAYVEEEKVKTGISSLKVKNNNIIGLYLEVTKSNLAAVPTHFVRKQSLVNGERYTTERLLKLEEQLNHATELCIERERMLFLQIRTALKSELLPFLVLSDAIAQLDCAACLAWVATSKGYTRPVIRQEVCLDIRGGRHPVVEEYLGKGTFIPNDIILGNTINPACTALITGPNMAGKSTYLRQTALIVLMAHIGSFVPAEQAIVGLADRIFCRVGSSDNLARGESTFLVEMNETAYILRSASAQSLVIMDEVGRGTSTQDGLSIARAILEYILETVGCRCLFATHFHELTDVESKNICNLSMVVDETDGQITFLKKVRQGPSNNSYGIHVARLAGLPERVILRAEDLLQTIAHQPHLHQLSERETLEHIKEKVPQKSPQSLLFSPLETIEQELSNFSVENSTPLQALAFVEKLKKHLTN